MKTYANIPGIPEGWQLVRIGIPAPGEMYLGDKGEPTEMPKDLQWTWPVAIIHNISAYGPPRGHLAIGQRARFRTRSSEEWDYGVIADYRPHMHLKWQNKANGFWYHVAQVETWGQSGT